MTTDHRRDALLASARSLCDSFANKEPLDKVLENFSTSENVLCYEHGLSQLAPFLNKRYEGLNGAREYFSTIADLLSYDNMKFSDYMADEQVGAVSVRGEATFTWKSTDNQWEEVFTYRLQFDKDAKVTVYEVWADSGAAYLASKGMLK